MKLLQKARLVYPDQRTQLLGLFQVETAVFRWVVQDTDRRCDGVDYVDKPSAVVGLRVTVEGDPAFKGCDLTVKEIEPSPEERAALLMAQMAVREVGRAENLEDLCDRIEALQPTIALIIQEETGLSELLEHANTILAYLITRGGHRDLSLGGLMLNLLGALEKTSGVKYDALRKALTEPPPMITPARNMPGNNLVQ